MRLFAVRNAAGKLVAEKGQTLFFESKADAKKVRDELKGHFVTCGPDHMGRHGNRRVRRDKRKSSWQTYE